MTTIAPILFDAFPEDAPHDADGPYLECFNAGASADGVAALSTPFKMSPAIWAAGGLAALGLAPMTVATMLFVFYLFTHDPTPEVTVERLMGPLATPASVLFGAGILWTLFLSTSLNPKAKAWKKALGEAWGQHGAEITVLDTLPAETREEVLSYAGTLEKVRASLNRLNPEGDELDVARYRLQQFIDASDLPELGKRAAEAGHITDRKVRQAAKEYKALAEQQKLARRAATDTIAEAGTLLVGRLQARNDAEIIRQVHQR